MPRTRIPVSKFPVDRCTWQTFDPSERIVFLHKKLRAKHGLAYKHFSGEEEDYLCEDYSLFAEWEAALLKGEPLWAVHAKFYNFVSWLELLWAKQDQTRDWASQEREAFLGVIESVTRDKVLLAHLSVGVTFEFDCNGRHISKCQLCAHTSLTKPC